MRFDCEQFCSECRTISHIRHRIKPLAPDAGPGDVDPILRYEFLIPRHVDGGYGVLRSVTAPSPGIALYAKRPRQQMTRAAYASLADQSANLTARNSFSPQLHLGIDLHLKSHLAPKFRQHVHV